MPSTDAMHGWAIEQLLPAPLRCTASQQRSCRGSLFSRFLSYPDASFQVEEEEENASEWWPQELGSSSLGRVVALGSLRLLAPVGTRFIKVVKTPNSIRPGKHFINTEFY